MVVLVAATDFDVVVVLGTAELDHPPHCTLAGADEAALGLQLFQP